jgi:hypothetical protein
MMRTSCLPSMTDRRQRQRPVRRWKDARFSPDAVRSHTGHTRKTCLRSAPGRGARAPLAMAGTDAVPDGHNQVRVSSHARIAQEATASWCVGSLLCYQSFCGCSAHAVHPEPLKTDAYSSLHGRHNG